MSLFRNLLLASLSLAALVSADGLTPTLLPLKVYANWEASEIESFEPEGTNVSGYPRELSNSSSVWFLESAKLSDNAKVYAGVGGFYFFILPVTSNTYSNGQRSAFGLTDLHGEFDFWKKENSESDHGLRLNIGVFNFKYNPDVKNLGEYMFRSMSYPTILITGGLSRVNWAIAQLNGMDLNTKLGGFTNDFLITQKTDLVPSAALSATDIVSYSMGNLFTIGGGYMFENFYDPTKINSGKYDTKFSTYYTLKDGTQQLKKALLPSDKEYSGPSDSIIDTLQLSFKAQKAMVRGAISFGTLFSTPWISESDLRFYFEATILGVKNQPFYYTKMSDRTVYDLGFNFPTFKLLDLLSVEWEYCSNPYPNNMVNATQDFSPVPAIPSSGYEIRNGDNVKWTVYAKRNILPGFSISGHVANDHLRLVDFFGHTNDSEVMPYRKNWYWALQLGYAI